MSQPIAAEPGARAETDRNTWFRLDRHDPEPDPQAAPQAAPEADPATEAVPEPGANDPVDITKLPANVQQLITKLRTENASTRTTAKTKAAEEARTAVLQQIGEALGITEGTPDPAQLTQQLTQSQEDAASAQIELQVFKTATRLGADAGRLLDSRAFCSKVDGLDPSGDFGQQLEQLVASELASNPGFSSAPRNPAPDPSQGRGGEIKPTDYRNANPAEFAAELAKFGLRPKSLS